MNKKIKLAMVAGTVASVMAPLATLACGNTTKASWGLVTDAGDKDDKSFNQQGWDALKQITGESTPTNFVKPATHSAADISTGYQSLRNVKNILAPGYYHVAAIESYNDTVKTNRKNFVLVDGVVEADNVASVLFDTRYAAFQAGYLAAKYLELRNDSTPTLGTFGGGNFPGVTDFMVGFVYGAKYYNDTRATGKNAVAFATLATDADYTNTEFEAGGGTVASNTLIGSKTNVAGNADVLFPVAGPQTADAITAIGDNNRIRVIGVDMNQADIYEASKKTYFITSVEKKVKEAFVAVSKKMTESLGKTTIGGLNEKWVGISDNTGQSYGWIGETTGKTIYDAANSLTKTQIDEAITGFATKTWAQALADLKLMNNNDAKA